LTVKSGLRGIDRGRSAAGKAIDNEDDDEDEQGRIENDNDDEHEHD